MNRFSRDEFSDWLYQKLMPEAVIRIYPDLAKAFATGNDVVRFRIGSRATSDSRAYYILQFGSSVFVHRLPEQQRSLLRTAPNQMDLVTRSVNPFFPLAIDRPPIVLGESHVYNVDSDHSSLDAERPMEIAIDVESGPSVKGALTLQVYWLFEEIALNSFQAVSINLDRGQGMIRAPMEPLAIPEELRCEGMQSVGVLVSLLHGADMDSSERVSTYGSGFLMLRCSQED